MNKKRYDTVTFLIGDREFYALVRLHACLPCGSCDAVHAGRAMLLYTLISQDFQRFRAIVVTCCRAGCSSSVAQSCGRCWKKSA